MVMPLGWGTPTWEARWSVHGANTWHTVHLDDAHRAVASVDGLTPGTWYDLQFRYTNDFGTGAWGTIVILTTGTAPAPSTTTGSRQSSVLFRTVAYTAPGSVAQSSYNQPNVPAAELTPSAQAPTSPANNSNGTRNSRVGFWADWYWPGGALVILIAGFLFFGLLKRGKA